VTRILVKKQYNRFPPHGFAVNQMASLIEMLAISKVYGQGNGVTKALDNLDLTVEEGGFIALMGPSGSGKTTLIHIMGFVLKPTSGKYLFKGKDYGEASEKTLLENRRRIGFIFQSFHLLPMLNVRKNVELTAMISGMRKPEREERVMRLIEQVGLREKADSKVYNLSRGQMQRVAIARALVNNPELILADEPTANLDSENRENIMSILERLNRETGVTIILATHDEHVANKCNRILYLENGRLIREA